MVALNKSSGNAVAGFLSLVKNFTVQPEVRFLGNNQISDVSGVSVGAATLLDLNGFSDTIGSLNMTGGSVTTGAGTLTLGGNLTTGITASTGTIAGNLSLGGAARTFTVGNNAPAIDVDVSASITNGGLVKDGAGTLRLVGSAANGFTQSVTVNTGELRLGKTVADSAFINVPVVICRNQSKIDLVFLSEIEHNLQNYLMPQLYFAVGTNRANIEINFTARFCQRNFQRGDAKAQRKDEKIIDG